MVTTIQLNESVKNRLDRIKQGKQTYEEVILNLIKTVQEQQRKQKELLIEGYKEMAKESKRIAEEWSNIDLENWPE